MANLTKEQVLELKVIDSRLNDRTLPASEHEKLRIRRDEILNRVPPNLGEVLAGIDQWRTAIADGLKILRDTIDANRISFESSIDDLGQRLDTVLDIARQADLATCKRLDVVEEQLGTLRQEVEDVILGVNPTPDTGTADGASDLLI